MLFSASVIHTVDMMTKTITLEYRKIAKIHHSLAMTPRSLTQQQCCRSGFAWIRNFSLDPDPKLLFRDPDPTKNERADK